MLQMVLLVVQKTGLLSWSSDVFFILIFLFIYRTGLEVCSTSGGDMWCFFFNMAERAWSH